MTLPQVKVAKFLNGQVYFENLSAIMKDKIFKLVITSLTYMYERTFPFPCLLY